MNPINAAEIMRNEAEHMNMMIQSIKNKKSSDFLKKDLLNWLIISLQHHADFKNSMADFISVIGQAYPDLQLTATITKADFSPTNEIEQQDDMEIPPFDSEFWMGLGDV
jgi:hypothetical protein